MWLSPEYPDENDDNGNEDDFGNETEPDVDSDDSSEES